MSVLANVAPAADTASDRLSELAHDIRALIRVTRASIVEIGRKLISAKARMKHGEWLPWLEVEFGWSEMTATRYMRVAQAFKSNTLLDFPDLTIDATALYALAASEVPEGVRDKAIETAKAGTHVTRKVALKLIEAAASVSVEATDVDAIDETEDATVDVIDTIEDDDDENAFPDRPPILNDDRWQETLREWIDRQRDRSIPLKDVITRFAETIPLHDAARRWYFDFEEFGGLNEMRAYALLVSLRSLGVKFSPPLGRGLCPASSETEFTVPPRRRRR